MELWHWESGRQGGGYRKLTLISSKRFRFDCHIIVLPSGSKVRPHKDPSPEGFEHHRINITLRRPRWGGRTFIAQKGYNKNLIHEARRAYKFRPDLQLHSVDECVSGSLWLLSFGWLKKHK